MTEEEYIKVSNKAALVCAMDSMRHVLPGDEWGVNGSAYRAACAAVGNLLDKAFLELDGTIDAEESK